MPCAVSGLKYTVFFMSYFDDEKKEKYIPYVIEPSLGADRVVLAFLCAAYDEENLGTEEKPTCMHPALKVHINIVTYFFRLATFFS